MSEVAAGRLGAGAWSADGPSPKRDERPIGSHVWPEGSRSSSYQSILYQDADAPPPPSNAPDYFHDLNLDQVVDAITAHKSDYDLKPFFYDVLRTTEAVTYRHEVMRELEDTRILKGVTFFARQMARMREQLKRAVEFYDLRQRQRWFLHAAATYCDAVRHFNSHLDALPLQSRGLVAFRRYLQYYASSDSFSRFDASVSALQDELENVRYCILIRDGAFKVRRYESEPDYSAEILETFKKFQQDAADTHSSSFNEPEQMNHIEAKVLEFVARLYPGIFAEVEVFCTRYQDFTDATLIRFDREIQFYISYREYMASFEKAGLSFCYPNVSSDSKAISNDDGFDLALAGKLIGEGKPVVRNDFRIAGAERILVVSGPNQGGKTTLARMVGQLHHFASIGCPVPGRQAALFLFDKLYVHFEREENLKNLRGKLQDDLIRIHEILSRASSRSIVIMNEIFTSTTLEDAMFLARKVIDGIVELDCLCVCVTFLEELSSLNDKTVSMVSTVAPDNPSERTFKVVRRPADGQSYALSIAEKYQVTYEHLKARIPS